MFRCHLVALSCLLAASSLFAQPASAPATAPYVPLRANGKPDYGIDDWIIPPSPRINVNRPRTVTLLADAIADARSLPNRRAQLVGEIGQCRLHKEGTPVIGKYLDDPDPMVRASAASAAAENGDTALLAPLATMVRNMSNPPDVRRAALAAHAKLAGQTPAAAAVIAAALGDTDPAVVETALTLAFTPEHAAVIAAGAITPQALDALGRIGGATGDPRHANPVAASLKGPVPLRVAAVRALGAMKAEARRQDVIDALRDPHPTVRREAILAVGRLISPPQRYELAIAMLSGERMDPDLSVREAAVKVLTPCPGAAAADAIVRQLGEVYRPLHQAGRLALTTPADDAAKQAVIDRAVALLDHANQRRREDGSYVLGRLKSTAGWDKHIAMLDLKNANTPQAQWSVMRQAAQSMGWIGDPRSGAALLAAAKAVNGEMAVNRGDAERGHPGEVFMDALIACGRVGHKPVDELCRKILAGNPEYQPSDLRAGAAFSLYSVLDVGEPIPGVFTSGLNNPREGDVARYEYIKGLGALRAKSAVNLLSGIEAKELPPMSYLAHWAQEQIQGKKYPFVPRPEDWTANVSIQDTTEK